MPATNPDAAVVSEVGRLFDLGPYNDTYTEPLLTDYQMGCYALAILRTDMRDSTASESLKESLCGAFEWGREDIESVVAGALCRGTRAPNRP